MPDSLKSIAPGKPRVRFAPSPTGFLHVGSARTFIFNWLYARRNHGTMILRLDDTDVGRNTDASVNSIFEGLKWLGLGWDEEYKQSERGALHRQMADVIFQKGLPIATLPPRTAEIANDLARKGHGCSIRVCGNCRAKKATGAPLRENHLPYVFACRERAANRCASPTRCTASK